MAATTLMTAGYEGRALDEFTNALCSAGVEVVVDVRELPLSRRRGFSKTALSERLREVGIRYEHDRRLGNPKPYRALYQAGHLLAGASAYRCHLHEMQHDALTGLADLIGKRRACLMCVESEPDRCHRAVIVEALVALHPDLQVRHL